MGVHHIRDPAELAAKLEGAAAQKGEALGIVREVALGLGAVYPVAPEEALVLEEIGLDSGTGKIGLVDGSPFFAHA
jgi:hypothetical protein